VVLLVTASRWRRWCHSRDRRDLDTSIGAAVPYADGVTSRRTSVAGTHAVDLVEAKGHRLEVVVRASAVGGTGAWVPGRRPVGRHMS
jgi:hypothetical protein